MQNPCPKTNAFLTQKEAFLQAFDWTYFDFSQALFSLITWFSTVFPMSQVLFSLLSFFQVFLSLLSFFLCITSISLVLDMFQCIITTDERHSLS